MTLAAQRDTYTLEEYIELGCPNTTLTLERIYEDVEFPSSKD